MGGTQSVGIYRSHHHNPCVNPAKVGVSLYRIRGPDAYAEHDEVNAMHTPLIVGIVVLVLLLLALIKMLPDLVRYMKIRSM